MDIFISYSRKDLGRVEPAEALDANKLVPAFLEPVKPPLYFKHVHGADISGWDGQVGHEGFQRLLRDCAELIPPPGRPSAPEPQPAKVTDPAPEPFSSFRDRLADGSEGPEMVWLPTGTFLMGSPAGDTLAYDDERPQHEVRMARHFAIGRVPVTFADYDRFCRAAGLEWPGDQGWGRDRRPVIGVSWEDAVAYCRWLSGQTGQTYRLPSEAEWEYACRAGTRTRWSCGDEEQTLGDHAWYDKNSGSKTQPVGEKWPNPWGLHDMHGNVWEWVQDQWHDHYQGVPTDGRAWEDSEGRRRVLRGGSWFDFSRLCRSASRSANEPGIRNRSLGFRLRLSRGPSPPGRSG